MSDNEALLAELQARQEQARLGGGAARLAKQRASGKLTARERVDYLLDPGSFMEIGLLAHSDVAGEAANTPCDSKITGFGTLAGRKVGVVAFDFTVKASTSSRVAAKKERSITELCAQGGFPLIYLAEAGGARIPDIMGAVGLATYGGTAASDDSFVQALTRQRRFPLVVAIMGEAFGEPTWMAYLADYVVMTKGSCLAVSGPRVLEIATAESVNSEDLGGWEMHATVTGMIDEVADNDQQALDAIRTYLSYMPAHTAQKTPRQPVPSDSGAELPHILDFLPTQSSKTYDMLKILERIVDTNSLYQLKKRFGRSLLTALARLDGEAVGIIASQPRHLGGAIDTDSIDKAVSFVCLCDSYNIPLLFFQDTPGFIVGPQAERKRAPSKIMTFLEALGQATVPKITVLVRKSYGMAFYNLGGTGTGATFIVAWPTAEISFVSEKVGVNVVYSRQLQEASDPQATREYLEQQMRLENSPYSAAGQHLIHDVIEPAQTRNFLIQALALAYNERTQGIGEHRLANWPKKY
jgi:acetyl-CoA carboxylase carboxyltransferase component